MPVRRILVITGFVQGVSYRKQTQRVAQRLGVGGWVRNVSDGSVEACLEGAEEAVEAVTAWCAFGPRKGRVDEVQLLVSRPIEDRAMDFIIREDRNPA